MTPRIEIIRRAYYERGYDRDGNVHAKCSILQLDGERFESCRPINLAQAIEINTALDRLVDFVNAVAVVK